MKVGRRQEPLLVEVLHDDDLWRRSRVAGRLDHEEPLPVCSSGKEAEAWTEEEWQRLFENGWSR